MTAIMRGLEDNELGRSGKPTQGDLERILGRRIPRLDEDTRRKYARLYRLTILQLPEAHSIPQWEWIARQDPEYVHRAFFTFGIIRDSAKERAGSGIGPTTKEEDAVRCYVRICKALISLNKPFSSTLYIETITF